MITPMRLLVIKLTSMGDVLFALSIVDDIKARFPDVLIDWVVDDDFSELVQSHSGIRTVFRLPLRRLSRGSSIANWPRLSIVIFRTLLKVRQSRYDLLIDMQGVIKSGIVSLVARSNKKWSYSGPHLEFPAMRGIFTDEWEPSRSLPAVFQHRVFAGYALRYRPDLSKTVFDFFPNQDFETNTSSSVKKTSVATVLLVPFSSKNTKQLDPRIMSEITRTFIRAGFHIAMVAGSESERSSALEIAQLANCEIDIVYRPLENFVQFRRRLANMKLCIGVDTGIIHVSAAFGIPTIGIFSVSDIEIYGPHLWAPHARSLAADQPELSLKVNAVAREILKIGAA